MSTIFDFMSAPALLVGTWELNGSADVHFHYLLYDPHIQTETDLKIFRRDIANCPESIRNMPKKGKQVDWMNNIVFLDKPLDDILDYMDKDLEGKFNHFPNYFIDPIPEP